MNRDFQKRSQMGEVRKRARPIVLDYLFQCNEERGCPFVFDKIRANDNVVSADILFCKRPFRYDYMHDKCRNMSTILAEDLREETGSSVYFDIRQGEITFFT
jgi:hypothetical protein